MKDTKITFVKKIKADGEPCCKCLEVERAPFFVVENSNAETRIYTIYLQFAKEIFHAETDESNEAKEILEANPDLDLI